MSPEAGQPNPEEAARMQFVQELGVRDGQFLVQRTGGQTETDWQITGTDFVPLEEGGEPVQRVVLHKYDEERGGWMTKKPTIDAFKSWQTPQEAEPIAAAEEPQLIEMPNWDAGEYVSQGEREAAAKSEALLDQAEALGLQMKALQEPFDEGTRHNIWQYASARLNKRDAQAAGNGAGSLAEGERIADAQRKLSPEAQQAADRYMRLLHKREELFDRIAKLTQQ